MRTYLPLFVAVFTLLSLSVAAQVGHWKLDNNFTDSSPNNIQSTLIGTPTFSTDSKEGTHAMTVWPSRAINLGTPAAFPTGNTPRTIAAWAKTNNISGSRMIMSMGTTSAGQAMFIGQEGSALVGGGWSTSYNIMTPGFWTTGTWHHITMTYDGTTARLYADGILVGSIAKTYNLVLSGAFIGKHVTTSGWWDGSIDDVRVYDRALSQSEVAALASGTSAPAAPTNLNASAGGSSSVNLTWTDNATNETGVQIERSLSAGSGFGLIHTTAADAVSFNDSGLSANTTYYYRIRAVGAGGTSGYSPTVNATTSSASTSNDPVAHWLLNGNVNDASGNGRHGTVVNGATYSTDRKEGSHSLSLNGAGQYVDFGNGAGLPSGLSPRTMSVWARTNSNASGYRMIVSYGNDATGQAMYIGQNGSQLRVGAFGGSTDVTEDNFWTIGEWRHVCVTYDGANASLYVDGSLLRTRARVWDLVLENGYIGSYINNSAFWNGEIDDVRIYNRVLTASEINDLATSTPGTPPAAPSNLTASPVSSSQINLSWTDNASDETGVQIERSLTAGSGFELRHTTGANATSFSDTGLAGNTTYYYRIRAIGSGGNSVYTTTVNATTSGSATGPVAHWMMNNNLNDVSGGNRPGTMVGGGTYSTNRKEGSHSLSLNGSGQYVNITNDAGLPSGAAPRTLSAWAMTNSTAGSGFRWVVAYGNDVPGQAMYIGLQGSDLKVGAYGAAHTFHFGGAWTVGEWKHVCLTYDGSIAKVYINGVEEVSQAMAWNLVIDDFFIGKQVNAMPEYWNGLIDDVRVYDRALTLAEVQDIAGISSGLAAPTNLAATAAGTSQINLTWSDNSENETGFKIEHAISAQGTFTPIHTTTANITSYQHTGLAKGSTHYYRVQAVNATDASALTTVASATTAAIQSTQEVINQYAFQYKYDARKRMIAKKVPGADWVYMVYDSRDRLVLTQDGNQRSKIGSNGENQAEWTFTKYDALNRPVLTGIYITSIQRDSLQRLVNVFYEEKDENDNLVHSMFEIRGSVVHGYTSQSFPDVTDENAYLTATFYDDESYGELLPDGLDFAYNACEIPDEEAPVHYKQWYYSGSTCGNKVSFPYLKGLVTATKIRILGESWPQWMWTVNHYDDKGRAIQIASLNGSNKVSRQTYIYDFVGKILHSKMVHLWLNGELTIVDKKFEYDHAGRLLKTWHRIGESNSFVLLSQNEYNELGQMVTKRLHSEDNGVTFAEDVEYRYNIRGWLTNINDPTSQNSGLFGMELKYHTPTLNGTSPQYNGNISQINWKGISGELQQYGYSYDPMNRLLEASYFNQTDVTKRFDEKIWNTDENASYDLNGNILGIQREGRRGSGTNGETTYGAIDELRFRYEGNQLVKVDELLANDFTGFTDGENEGDDYLYDSNGNMITDGNKNINAANTPTGTSLITYNHLNLPETVRNASGEYLRYAYDANGLKRAQGLFNSSDNFMRGTIYDGDFLYEAGGEQIDLIFINTEEGRVVMTGASPEYQYHLKDHLGNVRVTFSAQEQVETFMATMETTEANAEQSEFLRYDESVKVIARLFDHTHRDGARATKAKGKAVMDPEISIRLSGIGEERYGLAKSIRVMPGDKIRMEVFAKYVDPNKFDWQANFSDVVSAVRQAGPAPALDGALQRAAGGSAIPLTAMLTKTPGGKAPKAYLNYVMYDNDFNPIADPGQTNYVQVSETAKESGRNSDHEHLYAEVEAKQAGYIYIYLSNDNYELQGEQVDVFFDDFQIQQVHSKVVQSDDYYPFGLTFNSYKKENSLENKIKFQGQEHVDDLQLGWVSFKWRNHDPAIGRFFNVDPLAESFYYNSVYAFSENKVTAHVELEGLESWYAADGSVVHGPRSQSEIKKSRLSQQPSPSKNDIVLALVGTAGLVADRSSARIKSSRSGYSSGKLDPQSPKVFSKKTASNVNTTAKGVGYGLTVYSVLSTEVDFAKGEIDEHRRAYNQMNNTVGVFFPAMGIPIAVGAYVGQTNSEEIVNDMTEPGGIAFELTKNLLEFLGVPIAPPPPQDAPPQDQPEGTAADLEEERKKGR